MSNCPLCGSKALMMFVSISCGNQQCQNFDPNYVPPAPKYDFKVGDKIQFTECSSPNYGSPVADWSGFEEFGETNLKTNPLAFSPGEREVLDQIDGKWGRSKFWGLWFPLSAVKKIEG